MKGFRAVWLRMRSLSRGRLTRDLDDEIEFHLEMAVQEKIDFGLSPQQARFEAMRELGNSLALKERSWEMFSFGGIETVLQDVRHGLRALRKTPGFTAVAVLTLALGLGMNTAVFSIVNAVMIRGLPYQEPARLVSLWEEQNGHRTVVSPGNLADYQRSRSFAGLAGFDNCQMNLTGGGAPERIWGESVTANFFDLLSVAPAQGRAFLGEEDQPGGAAVVMITHDFWQRRLGADQNVLSRTVTLDGRRYQIVGVLPNGFQSPARLKSSNRIEFYVPAAYPKELLAERGDHEIQVLGRLKPGVSIQTAQEELGAISARIEQEYPTANRGMRAKIGALQNDIVRSVKDSLIALQGAAGLIVLITCVNLAGLFLVRAVARRHETSVRFALGAGRLRIVRQFLAESTLVAAAGCGAGLMLGHVMMQLLVAIAPPNTPRLDGVSMDWRVFAVSAALAAITGIAFGIAPAWQASRAKPAESLKAVERNAGGRAQARWRMALTVAEVALSMVLLIGAGLLLKSFVRLMGVDLGFQPERVLAMSVNLPEARYRSAEQRLQFFQRLEERVAALPGVQSVAFSNRMPLRGGWSSGLSVDTQPGSTRACDFQAVSPDYFATLGMPLLRGRLLTPDDRAGREAAGVVNQTFAREFFPDLDPIGRRLRRGSRGPWITIVGVVSDIRRGGKASKIAAGVYLSAAQTDLYPVRLADFAIRAAGDPRRLVNAVQTQVWSLDKDQPVTDVKTLAEIISASVAARRFQVLLLVTFATMALGIAVLGVFGVLSYTVSQRTREMGIRIALGADPHDILAMVLKQAVWLISAGVLLGLAGAYALAQYVGSLLFEVQPHDGMTYSVAVAALAATAIAASLAPARRGARVDPTVALRYE